MGLFLSNLPACQKRTSSLHCSWIADPRPLLGMEPKAQQSQPPCQVSLNGPKDCGHHFPHHNSLLQVQRVPRHHHSVLLLADLGKGLLPRFQWWRHQMRALHQMLWSRRGMHLVLSQRAFWTHQGMQWRLSNWKQGILSHRTNVGIR